MNIPRPVLPALVLASGLLATACGSEEKPTRGITPETAEKQRALMDPVVVSRLDSGNAAYRDGEYERALTHFRRAVRYDSSNAAAWFGVFMTHRAMGNTAAADSAMGRVRKLTPEASLAHPADSDTSSP